MITEILQTKLGIILISIIWGLGLSTLFRKVCHDSKCHVIVYNGPQPDEIQHTYYDYGDGNCYKYYPFISQCN